MMVKQVCSSGSGAYLPRPVRIQQVPDGAKQDEACEPRRRCHPQPAQQGSLA